MNPRIKHSLETLAREAAANEEPMYAVGGTLRDALLGRDFNDLDLACPNARQWAEGFARSNRTRCVTLHDEPGQEVYRVPLGKNFFCDFGTLRGNGIEDDLALRDFTINALAQPLDAFLEGSEEFIDPYQGRENIQNRVIRLLPGTPIEDDPLRMLRAFRFAALLDFEVVPDTLLAIQNLREQITSVSGERISQELLKLFAAPGLRGARLFAESGLLTPLRTGAGLVDQDLINPVTIFNRFGQWQNGDIEPLGQHRPQYKNYFKEGEHRSLFGIAALVVPKAAPAQGAKESPPERFMQHYRFSNPQRDYVTAVSGLAAFFIDWTLTTDSPPSPKDMFQWCDQQSAAIIPALLLALFAHPEGDNPPESLKIFLETLYDFHTNRYVPVSKLEPLLTGNDLMEIFNLHPSPLFKTILQRVAEARVLGDIETREQAEALTRKFLEDKSTTT